MSRSSWKGPYHPRIKLINNRRFHILPNMIGETLIIYNGKSLIHIKITPEMINRKIGEFAWTRKHLNLKLLKEKKHGKKD